MTIPPASDITINKIPSGMTNCPYLIKRKEHSPGLYRKDWWWYCSAKTHPGHPVGFGEWGPITSRDHKICQGSYGNCPHYIKQEQQP